MRFVSDSPPPALVQSAAQVYLASDTSIEAVLRHIFESEAFWQSSGAKLRRPLELVAGLLRAVEATLDPDPVGLAAVQVGYWLELMGQPLYFWAAPDGFPEKSDYWLTTDGVARRWQFAELLAAGDLDGVGVDTVQLIPNFFSLTPAQWVEELQLRLLGKSPYQTELYDHLIALGAVPIAQLFDELVALILASPDFQVR